MEDDSEHLKKTEVDFRSGQVSMAVSRLDNNNSIFQNQIYENKCNYNKIDNNISTMDHKNFAFRFKDKTNKNQMVLSRVFSL